MEKGGRLDREFFIRDVLEVAPDLPGKNLVFCSNGSIAKLMINEVEAYRGEEDLACHAAKGRTKRTEMLYHEGGNIYVYFIYGMYWMLNFVTGSEGIPQAVLIRGAGIFNGPGKLARAIGIDRSFYGEDLTSSDRIWVEETGIRPVIQTSPRIGVDYSGETWKNKPWRYFIDRRLYEPPDLGK
ncbi:MAG TPA: DNA-3-methyladenine glycosylase [Bacteroidales bacterium]|nr:DNA-3-methyladenine glycosylase [Bacteroidales bacterium]